MRGLVRLVVGENREAFFLLLFFIIRPNNYLGKAVFKAVRSEQQMSGGITSDRGISLLARCWVQRHLTLGMCDIEGVEC
jgi:hypothetical protein